MSYGHRSRPAGDYRAATSNDQALTVTIPPREGTAWLRGQVARRIRAVAALGLNPHGPGPVVIATLGEPSAPDSTQDRRCDRCRTYHPDGLWCAAVIAAPRLTLILGLCDRCWRAEVAA